ncbi:hypothetical protein FOXG_12452 [Fusarium oxysporum f. sp. lycopersici 4287]|uniref:DUF7923 domain-containing protein n=2 Tax=Fusarium oxysporum f. sp. lycopersici (strain 4287 / CBS 123668 / FGSC 9935 / NRRL 34936) TaxID=426428 RepID=A0A0J9WS64_FUSO4|nr:hypothetical protein FOXG_12452 [Fusarium oxysporum f. sp. lycopersici 4287]EWZ78377.1 hypothetical protein FOWG_17348 [Fusarium oxysporum f. sp. lycopersici MN25]KNB13737.1 hypothetical protein FOXG_12452 [Fusarium oxysporum f. sp. lycopersici 4287]
METGLEIYRGRFADIRAGLAGEVDRGMVLIEELMKELECTKAALTQTKLDLDNECDARRRLQQEVQEGREWKERQGRRPFVVALIDADADGYVFHDNFITSGAKGGKEAADALLAALQQYVRKVTGEPSRMDILVRAFANVSGLGAALERDGRLRDAGQLRAFASGFSSRQAFFDFVDVGPGKERADLKVREGIEFFLDSFQCKHLVLACGHDSGYEPVLGQFVGDKQVAERITLLEGSPFPAAIRDLGLKTTQFSSIFNKVRQPPVLGGRGVTSTMGGPLAHRDNVGRLMAVSGNPLTGYHNPQVQSDRLGPVLTDQGGRRFDRPLQVNPVVVERIKKGSLCYFLFLRGNCVSPKCGRNHVHRSLTDEEFDALWWLARQGRCHQNRKADRDPGNDCSDARCVYGHRSGENTHVGREV